MAEVPRAAVEVSVAAVLVEAQMEVPVAAVLTVARMAERAATVVCAVAAGLQAHNTRRCPSNSYPRLCCTSHRSSKG